MSSIMNDEAKVYQEILQIIKRDIVLGKVRPNEKLPSERKLSDQFRVGRGTIREVLKTLEAIGLLTVVRGRGRSGGYFISDSADEISKDALFSAVELEDSILIDSLAFRKMFEPKACFLAAAKRNVKNLDELESAIRTMERDGGDPDVYSQSNIDFHFSIVKASNNPFIIKIYPHLFQTLRRTGKMVHQLPTQVEATKYFHRQIYMSIKKRNAENAEFLMDAHLSYVQNDIREGKELSNYKPQNVPRKKN